MEILHHAYILLMQHKTRMLRTKLIVSCVWLNKSIIEKVINVQNMQPFLHLRAAGCLNTAY
jgi:hypothetical protein